MAAGEDEAQAVVLDRVARVPARLPAGRIVGDRVDVPGGVVEGDEAPLAPDPVDAAKPPRRDEPRDRVRRNALRGPLLRGRDEGVVQGVLGEIEAAEEAHQSREDAPAFLAIQRGDEVVHDGQA